MATLLRGAAFITGAGSGIGQYTAYALARHGVRQLALCDINPSALDSTTAELRKSNNDALEILNLELDTRNEDSVTSAVDQTIKKFGRIDIAINNAGVGGAPNPTTDVPLADWQNVIAVNLTGVFLCQRAQIRQMLTQAPLDPSPRGSRGVIVNTASMLGLTGASPNTPATAYAASKHGVIGLTRTDAMMYARRGVRINAMCPGYVATPLLQNAMAAEFMAPELEKTPQGRFASMEEIGDAMVFLASPMSSFMTGSALCVDGGFTAGHF